MKNLPRSALESIELARREGRITEGSYVCGVGIGPPQDSPEEDFQRELIGYARSLGWKVAHFRKAMTKNGRWVTAVAADGKGFTDCVFVRDRVFFAELKSETGVLSEDQKNWRDWLTAANAEWYCFQPTDWDQIREVLK